MKYYSEKLKKTFDKEEDCLNAEKQFEQEQAEKEAKKKALNEERANRAKEIEDAYKAATEAFNNCIKKRNNFIKDYGYYHMSYSSTNDALDNIVDFFSKFW